MADSAVSMHGATIGNALGPMLVGTLVSTILWGVTCAQTFDYFNTENLDSLLQKLIVTLLWALDTLTTVMDAHMVYHYLVTNYANPEALLTSTWSINCQAVVAGFSNFIIRCMFVRRIYHFGGKNVIIASWIMILSVGDFVVATILTVNGFKGLALAELKIVSRLLYVSFALGVAADSSVAIALCWLLQSAKTGFRRSDTLVNTLMAYVVNTGLLVTIDAAVAMITYIVMPTSLVFFGFYLVLGKLFVNAYLASLNARVRLRAKNSDSSLPFSRLDTTRSARRNATQSCVEKAMAISMQTTIERKVDDEVKISPRIL